LTLQALQNAGFAAETDPTRIDRERFHPYSGEDIQIAAVFTNPHTGFRIEAGISISDNIDMYWPYNWTGKAIDPDKTGEPLYKTGSSDNTQAEFMYEVAQLLSCAEFGRFHPWSEEYKDWKRKIDEQLAPLYGEAP